MDDLTADARPDSRTARNAADAPLRENVRRIGATVGEMLAEQQGPAFLDGVETVRTTAIRDARARAASVCCWSIWIRKRTPRWRWAARWSANRP